MIHSIQIENFRQFDKINIDDFKRINFLVGRNNCGKTSVLEALFWSLSPINVNTIGSLYSFRRMIFNANSLKTLFLNKDETKLINIQVKTDDNQEQTFELTRNIDIANQTIIYKDIQPVYTQSNNDEFYKCKVTYQNNDNKPIIYNGNMNPINAINPNTGLQESILQLNWINISNKSSIKSIMLTGAFLSDYIGYDLMVFQLNNIKSSIDKRKQIDEYIKYFDSSIQSLEFGTNNSINIITKDDVLPLEVMGDGFKKYLRIVVGLVNNGLNILLIDEIENGLHHITQRKLLKIILNLSKEKNIQMFITTHSLETLKFLSEIIEEKEFSEQKTDVQVINISNTALGGYQAFNYNMDKVINYIETESELRD